MNILSNEQLQNFRISFMQLYAEYMKDIHSSLKDDIDKKKKRIITQLYRYQKLQTVEEVCTDNHSVSNERFPQRSEGNFFPQLLHVTAENKVKSTLQGYSLYLGRYGSCIFWQQVRQILIFNIFKGFGRLIQICDSRCKSISKYED